MTMVTSPRLQSLVQRAPVEREAAAERCELCSAPIPSAHRHQLDLRDRELICTCRACSLLFDREAAGAGKYRLVAWNEQGGQTDSDVEVHTSGHVSGTLAITLDSRNYRLAQHLNKLGRPRAKRFRF